MFAAVYLPQFSLQAVLRHEPEPWRKPVALVDPSLSTPIVCDLTETARQSGVTEGLTPTQALARCREIVIRHRSPNQEMAATDVLLQCAFGFSPNIEATAPGVCTLDLQGLAVLSQANARQMTAWAERLRRVLTTFGLRAQVGIALTPNLARQAACWSQEVVVIENPREFMEALPVASLEPSTDVATILEKWGIRTVGELVLLGQEAVAERIGLEALALFAAASTTSTRPLRLAQPAERFHESFEFEPPVETSEPLLFILRRFVDQLCPRLELLQVVAASLRLRLGLESGERLERVLRVPQPTAQADVLFRMLQTYLETLRTDAPIVTVFLEADPGPREQKQLGLFEVALRDPHQFRETLARLAALLGADRVGTPVLDDSHHPDAFKLVPPDFENAPTVNESSASGLLTALPIRRLRPRMNAVIQTEATVLANQPVSLRCAAAQGTLRVALGPWRASGQWWESAAWQREEWDVETSDGTVVRLNQDSNGWQVEGILD
jgi:protein ImuB